MLRKFFAITAISVIPFTTPAQIREIDSAILVSYFEFLDQKLSYSYYNPELKNWWINKFDYKFDERRIIIKNTASKDPRIILGKKYIEKSFRLDDMNPFTIDKVHLDHVEGRMVVGEEIILYTVKHKPLISKKTNGVSGSSQSFLHISIPTHIEDSIHVTDSIIQIFKEIINYATTIHNLKDKEANKRLIFETLSGNFEYKNNLGDVKRFMNNQSESEIIYEDYQDRQKLSSVIFGYDIKNNKYYEKKIIENKESIQYFTISDFDELVLESEDKQTRIILVNKSRYFYESAGRKLEFNPS